MNRHAATIAFLAASLALAACGRGADDGSPTAAENDQLNNIAEDLDASPDSLVAEDGTLGNGDTPAETGDLPVVGNAVVNDAAANAADQNGE
jgi:hypothetical protein